MQSDCLDSRLLFHAACAGVKCPRPPVWVMRQAGRYLPEYRQLKLRHGFLEIVKTPELAVEATLQPIRRFGFDCAIVFSDILVISEALGIPYDFKDGGGIVLSKKIRTLADVAALDASAENIRKKLSYVADALKILRRELPKNALLGFCGAPFTLGAYMVEGQSSTDFSEYKKLISNGSEVFAALMEKLTAALCQYVSMQCECGVDAVQIFDSHAALAPENEYEKLSGKNCKKILRTIRESESPARGILFANAMDGRFGEIISANADVYSVSSGIGLSAIMENFGGKFALQGNLNPASLSEDSPEQTAKKTREIVGEMLPYGRHIFNLGHGIKPDAKIENVEAMCAAIREFD